MTEDEAKTKWCPFSRVVHRDEDDQASWNRLEEVEDSYPLGASCIASQCMAWRWVQRITNQADLDNSFMWSVGGKRPQPQFEDTEHGFCGLAGKP